MMIWNLFFASSAIDFLKSFVSKISTNSEPPSEVLIDEADSAIFLSDTKIASAPK